MVVLTPYQAREMDSNAVHLGMTSLQLMENAANGLFQAVMGFINALDFPASVCIVCGTGNNGGDGYALARLLHTAGIPVTIIAPKPARTDDAIHNQKLCLTLEIPIIPYSDGILNSFDIIIDALLGTGVNHPLSKEAEELIKAINLCGKVIIAADLPSGMDGLTGLGYSVNAHMTVTFGAMKLGLCMHPEKAGDIIVAGIGIPPPANSGFTLSDSSMISRWLPRRPFDAHKGTQGHVLTLAGSRGMCGAASFAASAALRTGAGLVTVATTNELYPIIANNVPEALYLCLEDTKHGGLSGKHRIDFTPYDAVILGPGLSRHPKTHDLVRVIADVELPQVWDADALNIVADDKSIKYPKQCIITPHPGEMARLCGISVNEVQNDRIGTAKRYAQEKGVITVLKGYRTIIATPDGEIYINPTGSPAMASAGMGDALAGIIGALLARGLTPGQAAVCGVYLHGLAGEQITPGETVTDLIGKIPFTLQQMLK